MAGHAIVTQQQPTTPQTQDYTKIGLGTPKGYLAFSGLAVSLNASLIDQGLSMGASDLSGLGDSIWTTGEDGISPTNTAKRQFNDSVVGSAGVGATTRTQLAQHNAVITNGVQLNWLNATTARQVTALIFNEGVDQFNVSAPLLANAGDTIVTTGFMPDAIIGFNVGIDVINSNRNAGEFAVCFYKRTGNIYTSSSYRADDNVVTPTSGESRDNDRFTAQTNNAGNTFDEWTVGSFTSTGFTATKIKGSSSRYIVWVSLSFLSGYDIEVGDVSAPLATGPIDLITGLNGTPQLAIFAGNGLVANPGTASTRGSYWLGATDVDNQFAIGGVNRDGGINSTTRSLHHTDSCIVSMDNDGNTWSQASFDSFSPGTVRLNFSIAARAQVISYLVITNTGGGVAPILSSPIDSAVSWDKSSGSVTSDTGSGTLFGVETQSTTTPTAIQIANGQDHTGAPADAASSVLAGVGVNQLDFIGLSENTQYYTHFTQSGALNAVPITASGFTTPANQAPIVNTPIPDQTVQIGVSFSLDVSGNFSDPDSDPLTFSQTGLPNGLSISFDGIISGVPTGGFS